MTLYRVRLSDQMTGNLVARNVTLRDAVRIGEHWEARGHRVFIQREV